MKRRQPDPFELAIALRERLGRRGRADARGSERVLRAVERALAEAKEPGYEAVRRSFHARGPRSLGAAVAERLLPPVPGAVAPRESGLGATLRLRREDGAFRGTLVLENRLGRPLRVAVHAADAPEAAARLVPDEPLAPDATRRCVLELASCALAVDLCDGGTLLARVFVSEAAAGTETAEAHVTLGEPDAALLGALRGLQEMLLEHPRAARRLLGALAAEGRRFAETAEGERWLARLDGSRWLHEARLVFQMTSLSLLEHLEEPAALPSAYLDAFFMAAAAGDPDGLLDRLFGGEDE